MLDIKQAMHVLNISRPTALNFAHEVGEMVDGKWLIPTEAVAARIAAERRTVEKKAQRLQLELAVRIME